MSWRILRVEMRRSVAIPIGLIVLLLPPVLMLTVGGGAGWDTQWSGLAQKQRTFLDFTWPLVLGGGAWQGLRDTRSRTNELLATMPRPHWRRATQTAGLLGFTAVFGYLVMLVAGGAEVAGNTSYFHTGWISVAIIGMLSILAGALLGYGFGRTFPSPLTPPLLAVVGMTVSILGNAANQDGLPIKISLLTPNFSRRTRDAFTMVAPSVNVGQAVWFAGLTATGLVLILAVTRRGRLLAGLPVLVAALIAVPILPSARAETFVRDSAAAALVCGDDAIQVCVTRAHEKSLNDVALASRDSVSTLGKLPNPPTAVVEMSAPALPRSAEVVALDLGNTVASDNSRDELRQKILAGAGTQPCPGPTWGEQYLREQAARVVATGWLNGHLQPLPDGESTYSWTKVAPLAEPAWDALRALPAAEQQAHVAAFRAAALRCQGDLLDVLVSGARP